MSTFDAPQIQLISSVATFVKKERKNVCVRFIKGLELVFAVGISTGSVSIFCLLGRKMQRVCRANYIKESQNPQLLDKSYPVLFVDTHHSRLYSFGFHKPISFKITWRKI